jgi:hypothetical protein
MRLTVRDLINEIDAIIENYVSEAERKGENYDINKFLDATIILGDDDELNGVHACHTIDWLNSEEVEAIREISSVTIGKSEEVVLFC